VSFQEFKHTVDGVRLGVQIVSCPPDQFCIQNRRFETLPRATGTTAVSQFPTEHRNRGCVKRVVVGVVVGHEFAGRRPVAMQRPEPADAQDRTVTLSVQITGTQR